MAAQFAGPFYKEKNKHLTKIITKPLAGLANKLRAIESSLSLARDLNCAVEIAWVPDFQMVAGYHELMEPSELFRVTDSDKYRYCRSSFSLKGYKKPVARLINSICGIDLAFNDVDIGQHVRPGVWNIATLAKDKTVFIDTCHDFYPYHYNFSWVKPLPRMADAISSFTEKIRKGQCIGLHLRRTDHAVSIAQSPDELFEHIIRQEIGKDAGAIFFLATDNPDTQQHFLSLFGPERILVYPKKFGRDNVIATQDALVDWMLLGRCSKLYCSFWSSFSETAASVAGTKAITLNKDSLDFCFGLR